uniref:Mitogen-activated protein kinase kinase kinase n=1 Tax=Plectus sambesii TaxID=2011161 RepID=A0A914VMS5_9BILA
MSNAGGDFSCAYPVIQRTDLTIGHQLGCGSFGSVYRAVWKSQNMTVAVKKVFMLEKEVEIMSKIRHRNIIQFYGVCPTDPDFFILTEYAMHGSLYDYLHNLDNPDLTFIEILAWSEQMGQGLHYLHYEAPDITIHRDMKSKNVVLSEKLVCKLCDFGTSKNLTHTQTAWTWGGTAAWMSPEIINQSSSGISTATDVWSYAVVLWEMLTREIPYDGLTEFRIYSLIAEYGTKLIIPESCPDRLTRLIRSCWKRDPKERIDFKQILAIIRMMRFDEKFGEECQMFLEKKDTWKPEIVNQIRQLKKRELKIARKTAELDRLERQLAQRTQSGWTPLVKGDLPPDDITFWTEEHVCNWLAHIHLDITESAMQLLYNAVRRHQINGQRLLNLSKNDLKFLGVRSLGHRVEISRAVKALRKENSRQRHTHHSVHQVASSLIPLPPVAQPDTPDVSLFKIIVQVMLYQRTRPTTEPSYRFKILVDSDWDENQPISLLPPKMRDSNALIQNVVVTTLNALQKPLGEPTKRSHAPFGLSHWLNAPTGGESVKVMCAVGFSDRVLRPRNTRIEVEVSEFGKSTTLLERCVELTLRPYAKKVRKERPLRGDRIAREISTGVDGELQGAFPTPVDSSDSAASIRRPFDGGLPNGQGRRSSETNDNLAMLIPPPHSIMRSSSEVQCDSNGVSINDQTSSSVTSSSSSVPTFSDPMGAMSDEALLRMVTSRNLSLGNGLSLSNSLSDSEPWLKSHPELVDCSAMTNGLSLDETDSMSKKSNPTDSSQQERHVDSTKGQCDSASSSAGMHRRDEAVKLNTANVSRLVYGGLCKWAWKRKLKPIHYRSGGGDTVWLV